MIQTCYLTKDKNNVFDTCKYQNDCSDWKCRNCYSPIFVIFPANLILDITVALVRECSLDRHVFFIDFNPKFSLLARLLDDSGWFISMDLHLLVNSGDFASGWASIMTFCSAVDFRWSTWFISKVCIWLTEKLKDF